MGQNLFINFDSETLTNSRCRAADDLRSKKFSPFVAGDSLVFDLFLTGTEGLLNIQDYPVVRMGVGDLNARPESGTYEVGGFSLDYNHSAAELEATIESATGNGCTVVELAPFVFKVSFDAVGAQAIPAIDSSDLTPRSTVDRQTLQLGDATTKEIWLWRLYANPVAFTDSFSNIAGDGVRGTIPLSTAGIYDLLGDATSVKTFFEIELTDSVGDIITVLQTRIDLTGEVIGEGFAGYIPAPTPLSGDIQAFLASADYAAARNNLLDTDSVIWCNNGDNIQDKYNEAAALTPNGNPLSPTNLASLIVMSGTYADLDTSNANEVTYINIIGIGEVNLVVFEDNPGQYNTIHYGDYKNFQCESFLAYQSMGTIENITVIPLGSTFEVGTNLGTIRNVSSPHVTINSNTGTVENVITTGQWYQDANSGEIKNCSAAEFLEYSDNTGIIDNCHSTGTLTRAFGGYAGLKNSGTIKNCTAKGARSFGEQTATGVTENCTAVVQGFGGTSSQITSGGGTGTYKNCTGGVGSFFGVNADTTGFRVMLANYINCTAQQQSFGYCNTSGATTVFSGTAKNCTAGFRSFAGADAGNAQISTGAIIENCSAGNFSFASDDPNTINSGIILRCRTTSLSANAFRVDGATGIVRLCLDGNFNEVNLG